MVYSVIIFAWRKPGTSPAQFKQHYENSHVPLVKSLAGPLFPKTHTRHYIQRNPTNDAADSSNKAHPATVLVGEQDDFSYDAYAELVFQDVPAFQQFFGCITGEENAKKIAADEEQFLDRAKMRAVAVDETTVTT